MPKIALKNETDWDGWRQAARRLVLAGIEPEAVAWTVGGTMDQLPEASGSFNAMFTHRVRVSNASEIDGELKRWLKKAYDEA